MITIVAPTGKSTAKLVNIPIMKHNTDITALAITTCLYVLNICLADKTGKTINDVINNVPITFIPITTVNAHKTEIIIT